jgi:hypothetical protein
MRSRVVCVAGLISVAGVARGGRAQPANTSAVSVSEQKRVMGLS